LIGLELSASSDTISTRDVVTLLVMAEYEDSSSVDVTDQVSIASTDSMVVMVVDGSIGQPINAGEATLTATWNDQSSNDVAISVTLDSPIAGDLVINELLADATVDGDPNDDGVVDAVEDEFIEIANASDVTVDLSGVTLVEADFMHLARHTFADGTVLRAGEAIVVFGGGDVSSLTEDNVRFQIASNEDPGIQYGLALTDSGDRMRVLAADGSTVLAEVAYGSESLTLEAASDESLTLSPDVWGTEHQAHSTVAGAVGRYSPGTFADGASWVGPQVRYSSSER